MKRKTRPIPKGRAVDAKALEEVRALIGDAPRRRDLLIEHLHKLNDHFGHLPAAHLAALAQDMGLALAEVYEVATFYHHFEVVKEGEAPPPALTVRVCDSIACELAGARELLKLDLGASVRVIPAPCVGRCEVAPCVVVGQNPIGNATTQSVRAAVQTKEDRCPVAPYIGYADYRKDGGYRLLADCLEGKHTRDALTKAMAQAASYTDVQDDYATVGVVDGCSTPHYMVYGDSNDWFYKDGDTFSALIEEYSSPERGSCAIGTLGAIQNDFYPTTAALRDSVADTNVKAALAMLKNCPP